MHVTSTHPHTHTWLGTPGMNIMFYSVVCSVWGRTHTHSNWMISYYYEMTENFTNGLYTR